MNRSRHVDIELTQDEDLPAQINLERIRQQQLDISNTSSFIHDNPSKAHVVRLVEALPDKLNNQLREGSLMRVMPVPAPTQQELLDEKYIEFDEHSGACIRSRYPNPDVWARQHDIDTVYDLSASAKGSKADNNNTLQTLLFPEQLDTQLHQLRHAAQTAIEESGFNILYLVTGYLEWFESPSSDKPHLSPLFALPIDLIPGKFASTDGLRDCEICLREEPLHENLFLSQRLMQDFGLKLPEINESTQSDIYFDTVNHLIQQHDSRWKIRRYASICLLDFSNHLLFQDMELNRWPDKRDPSEHSLIRQLFADRTDSTQKSVPTPLPDYLIDNTNGIHSSFPLVHDADSAQHSAVIDVVNGNNLLLQGPPGTGKSQTISNLIAACMNKGLRVLFVAEKLAALNTVKRHLDAAKLGDFCLELHGQKYNKESFLESLMDSYKQRDTVTEPAGLAQQINRYESHRGTLQNYERKLHQLWRSTGLTPHQILQRAIDLGDRSPLDPSATPLIQLEHPDTISSTFITSSRQAAEQLETAFQTIVNHLPDREVQSHPWYGVEASNLSDTQRFDLFSSLQQWSDSQRYIMNQWPELQDSLWTEPGDIPPHEALTQLMGMLYDLPDDEISNLLKRVVELRDHSQSLYDINRQRQEFHSRFSDLAWYFKPNDLLDVNRSEDVEQALLTLKDELGLAGTIPVDKVSAHSEQLYVLQARIEALYKVQLALKDVLPPALSDVCEPTINGVQALERLLDIAQELPTGLWKHRAYHYTDSAFRIELEEVEPVILELRGLETELAEIFELAKLPYSRSLDDLHKTLTAGISLTRLKQGFRQAKQSLKQLTKPGIKPRLAIDTLPTLVNYKQGIEELTVRHRRNSALSMAFDGLETDLQLHRTMADWYELVNERFDDQLIGQSPRAAALFSLNEQAVSVLMRAIAGGFRDRANSVQASLQKVSALYPQYFASFTNDTPLQDPIFGVPGLLSQLDHCMAQLRDTVVEPGQSVLVLLNQANQWAQCSKEHQQWCKQEAYDRFVPSLFKFSVLPNSDNHQAESALSAAQFISKLAASSKLFTSALQKDPSLVQLSKLHEIHATLVNKLTEASKAQSHFDNLGNIERSHWLRDCYNLAQSHARNIKALQQTKLLDGWLSYQRVKRQSRNQHLSRLFELVESGTLPDDQLRLAVEADLYQQLAVHMMAEDNDIASLDGKQIQTIRKQLQRYGKDLLLMQRQQIAAKCLKRKISENQSPNEDGSFSELALIQHEANNDQGLSSVQSLLDNAPKSIQALKPCFMMSPLSVAQYLHPALYEFDVIIMDEASQIKPERVLGPIARAKQLVVIGDSSQLPPLTNLTRLIADDESTTGANDASGKVPSIMDTVAPLFQTRQLHRHYRSQHEALINFSNQVYYDSALTLFPSPFDKTDEYGIHFTRLSEATYVDGVNREEAERVVDLLCEQLQNHTSESVGVVAMTGRQRDYIETEMQHRVASDPRVQQAFESNLTTDEPLFIKHLGFIQGDERDVIITSMTFGPTSPGEKCPQSFGVFDENCGWQHLNVLLTRSRKRMEIIASMGFSDIPLETTNSQGQKNIKALLQYCETGHLRSKQDTETQTANAFLTVLQRKLDSAGYIAELQINVGRYSVDLAIRNPEKPGEFLMGIECDSANSYALNDKHESNQSRQDVLEKRGWIIRRISSTDWYRDPDAQLQPILEELEHMRARTGGHTEVSRQEEELVP